MLTAALNGVSTARAQDDLKGELTLWHGWSGAEADTLNIDVLPAWRAAHPSVKVTVLAVPFDQLKNKYQTEAPTGSPSGISEGISIRSLASSRKPP
jgi:ABC-type glycerol-3-phosphate transport system substrate-binding protein